ncbi:hypothetical protein N2599_12110 [Rhizobium sullae]|uniref:Uncharacterized protein n=1 Tax=Rhizobium sullae TaxID=50338 RepID=A0ABY5XEN9_RHISU|nr:hypothetical protein [Rhizobium sullae]UWU12913.1 hypothetical protein N2599_12110 [Rhizobium sullae]
MLPASALIAAATYYYSDPVDFQRLKPGEPQPAHLLIAEQFDRVCVLGPYEDRLHEMVTGGDRANEHLANIGYRGDEGRWAIILIQESKIGVLRFSRSAKLDFLAAHAAIELPLPSKLPGNFTAMNCADSKSAAFTIVEGRSPIRGPRRDNRLRLYPFPPAATFCNVASRRKIGELNV